MHIYLSAAFLTQTVALDDATVKFEIWDTAGTFRPYLTSSFEKFAQPAVKLRE